MDTSYNLEGKIGIRDADITYNPRDLHFRNTEVDLLFQNGDMVVKKMNTEINQNKVRINGDVRGFLRFFSTDSAKANFEWNIYSPHVDAGKLTSSIHRNVKSGKRSSYSFFDRLNDKIRPVV